MVQVRKDRFAMIKFLQTHRVRFKEKSSDLQTKNRKILKRNPKPQIQCESTNLFSCDD